MSFTFGADVVAKFLQRTDLDLVSHALGAHGSDHFKFESSSTTPRSTIPASCVLVGPTLAAGATWPNVFAVARRAKGPHFTTAAYYSWPPLSQLLPRAYLNATLLAPCSNCDQCHRDERSW